MGTTETALCWKSVLEWIKCQSEDGSECNDLTLLSHIGLLPLGLHHLSNRYLSCNMRKKNLHEAVVRTNYYIFLTY